MGDEKRRYNGETQTHLGIEIGLGGGSCWMRGEKETAFIPLYEDHGSPSVARQSDSADDQDPLKVREEDK